MNIRRIRPETWLCIVFIVGCFILLLCERFYENTLPQTEIASINNETYDYLISEGYMDIDYSGPTHKELSISYDSEIDKLFVSDETGIRLATDDDCRYALKIVLSANKQFNTLTYGSEKTKFVDPKMNEEWTIADEHVQWEK